MRNPLNSILATINKIKFIIEGYQDTITSPEIPSEVRDKLQGYTQELNLSTITLSSSTKLLNLTVSDIISLAQIESNNFRINISTFDIREAVTEIMELQKNHAEFNSINFIKKFVGFQGEYLLNTDEHRLQQILLNLQSNALKFTA